MHFPDAFQRPWFRFSTTALWSESSWDQTERRGHFATDRQAAVSHGDASLALRSTRQPTGSYRRRNTTVPLGETSTWPGAAGGFMAPAGAGDAAACSSVDGLAAR